ncbi:MAG: DUF4386 domain-containing protein [Promethearchaeota archaeon]
MNKNILDRIDEIAPYIWARVAGLLYLMVYILGVFANFIIREGLIDREDATKTANNILDNELLFRISIVSDLIMATCWALMSLALYMLFKSVNKNIASLMVALFLIGVPIMMLNNVNLVAVVLLLNSADYLTVFNDNELNALVLLFLDLHQYGYLISAVFTSFCLLPLGYLVLKSDNFPGFLGVLLIIGSILGLIDHFVYILFPSYEDLSMIVMLPLVIAELATCFFLLLKGAKKFE